MTGEPDIRGLERMSDEDLKVVGVIFQSQYQATGSPLYKQQADAVSDEQARRLAAAVNPYEE